MVKHSKTGDLIKNTAIIAAGKFSTQFLIFLLLPLYTSHLSTHNYGIVDLIVTYTSLFVPVVTLQQEFAVFRYLIDARGNQEKIREVLSSGLLTTARVLAISTLLYVGLSLFIDFPFKLLILPNIICVALSNYFLQVARGLGRNTLYSIACVIAGVTTVLVNIVLILGMGVGAESILISSIVANIACIMFLFATLKLHRLISPKSAPRATQKELVKYGVPLIFSGISWWIISVSDRSLIAAFVSVSASGIYAVATNFSSILNSIFYIFNLSWTESVSMHIEDSDWDDFLNSVFDAVWRLFFALGTGIVACLPFVFSFFVKEGFAEARNYIPLLVLGALLNSVAGFYIAIYVAKKEPGVIMKTSVAAAIINLLGNFVLIGLFGAYGAAISTILAFAYLFISRHFDISKKQISLKINPVLILSMFSVFSFVCLSYYINTPALNIATLVFVVVYAVLMNRNVVKIIKILRPRKIAEGAR